ncbi:hypothetical protein E5D57_000776 [Metarhizium anisopliae]|nr:hypothetical protein E5D57_000776 [Metarhizium anisopliae]
MQSTTWHAADLLQHQCKANRLGNSPAGDTLYSVVSEARKVRLVPKRGKVNGGFAGDASGPLAASISTRRRVNAIEDTRESHRRICQQRESIAGTAATPEEVTEAYIYCIKDSFTTSGVVESNNGGLLIGGFKDEFKLNRVLSLTSASQHVIIRVEYQ